MPEYSAKDTAHWKKFGLWLRSQRENAAMSRSELSKATGGQVSTSTLTNYELGGRTVQGSWIVQKPTDDSLIAIAKALQLPAEEVFAKAGIKPTWPLEDRRPASMFKTSSSEGDVTMERFGMSMNEIGEALQAMKAMQVQMNEMREVLVALVESQTPQKEDPIEKFLKTRRS